MLGLISGKSFTSIIWLFLLFHIVRQLLLYLPLGKQSSHDKIQERICDLSLLDLARNEETWKTIFLVY